MVILASEGLIEDLRWDEEDTARPDKRVRGNDSEALGVFTGYKDRTTIAYLKHSGTKPETSAPFLKQFGPNIDFDLERMDGAGIEEKSEWGPDLVGIMGWYWDQDTNEEVCFNGDGSEYMRYNPKTGQ